MFSSGSHLCYAGVIDHQVCKSIAEAWYKPEAGVRALRNHLTRRLKGRLYLDWVDHKLHNGSRVVVSKAQHAGELYHLQYHAPGPSFEALVEGDGKVMAEGQ